MKTAVNNKNTKGKVMSFLLAHACSVFMAFFAIMNPIANTAAFAGLTGSMNKEQQKAIAFKSLMITFIVITVFSVLGHAIFNLFGISLAALRITGGILIFIVGYHMLQGSASSMHNSKDADAAPANDSDIAISPLAVPLLAGPGTIATAMNYATAGGVSAMLVTVAVFFVLCVITFFCFIFSARIIKMVGQNGLSIVTRLMGLILAVIGTQMLIAGIQQAFKIT
jgi:multiple antibiotic resistance protein